MSGKAIASLPLEAPRFAVLVRGRPVWVSLLTDAAGTPVWWLETPLDFELDDYEKRRIEARAEEELLQRQHAWRRQREPHRQMLPWWQDGGDAA